MIVGGALWITNHTSDVIHIHSSPREQDGRHFADDIFKRIFLKKNVRISISHKFVPTDPIDNKPALVQVAAWRWTCDKENVNALHNWPIVKESTDVLMTLIHLRP